MTSKNKEIIDKLSGILLTAVAGAGIAFLQSLITQIGGVECPATDPAVAGSVGAGLRTAYLWYTSNNGIL